MRVGLFGFGKTGRIVSNEIMNDPDCQLLWVIRKSHKNEGEYASDLLGIKQEQGLIFSSDILLTDHFYDKYPVDVIIDFSVSNAVGEYIDFAKKGIRIVSAISRYDDKDIELLRSYSDYTAVLYSPNITLGINFLLVASKVLQQIVKNADIEIVEEHFREKKGVSGTALRIAEILSLDKEHQINSIRVGGIIGKHEVIFGLPNQTIRLTHESINRAAFGRGALYAAKWLIDKSKGLYTMEQAMATEFQKYADLLING